MDEDLERHEMQQLWYRMGYEEGFRNGEFGAVMRTILKANELKITSEEFNKHLKERFSPEPTTQKPVSDTV